VPDQLSLRVASLDLLVSAPARIAAKPIAVASEAPRVSVEAVNAETNNMLLAGVDQAISICVFTGSRTLAEVGEQCVYLKQERFDCHVLALEFNAYSGLFSRASWGAKGKRRYSS
jgi:hypothetical protein